MIKITKLKEKILKFYIYPGLPSKNPKCESLFKLGTQDLKQLTKMAELRDNRIEAFCFSGLDYKDNHHSGEQHSSSEVSKLN